MRKTLTIDAQRFAALGVNMEREEGAGFATFTWSDLSTPEHDPPRLQTARVAIEGDTLVFFAHPKRSASHCELLRSLGEL